MSLLGVHGKISSGKDTIGLIIQYLIDKNNSGLTYTQNLSKDYSILDDFNGYCNRILDRSSVFEIKKFADPLKDIVCILLGCTRKDLESQEFKSQELGEEWKIWKYTINEDENIFDGNCMITNGIFQSKQEAENFIKEHKIINILDIKSEILTPRMLLQQIGTDLFREQLHPKIWINALFKDYVDIPIVSFDLCSIPKGETLESYGIEKIRKEGKIIKDISNWVITDVRFPDEANYIKERGGILIKVVRDSEINRWKKLDDGTHEYPEEHISETALDNYDKFDYVIDNNGTIEELIIKIKDVLIKEHFVNG